MREPPEAADAPDLSLPDPFPKDPYGCDLDKFKQKTGKAPQNWNKTVQQASKIIIDDMRTKLELHYDDVHLQKWRKKHAHDARRAPGRRGAYKVFASVAECHRRKLNQDIELPANVKCILQGPNDETDWAKLEELRLAVCAIVEGELEVFFHNPEEIEGVAAAIEACKSKDHPDEVGEGSSLLAAVAVEETETDPANLKSLPVAEMEAV